MQAEDVGREIAEYEALGSGIFHGLAANGIDGIGELVAKARIAQGLTQEQMGEKLGSTQQQVQRYERDGYQKVSLWRLAEMADTLGIEISAQASIPDPAGLESRVAKLSSQRATGDS